MGDSRFEWLREKSEFQQLMRDGRPPKNTTDSSTIGQQTLAGDIIFYRAETAYRTDDKVHAGELAAEALGQPMSQTAMIKAKHLLELIGPQPPISISEFTGSELYLSDADWMTAKVGRGEPTRNAFCPDPRDRLGPLYLELAGKFYQKGLYGHAPSRYEFNLNGRWDTFEATVGLQTVALMGGRGVFIIKGDGREIYRSSELSGSRTETLNVDVKGVQRLELITAPSKGSNGTSWTIWCNPRMSR